MHRGVISSIGDPPPAIGGYLGALAAILRFLLEGCVILAVRARTLWQKYRALCNSSILLANFQDTFFCVSFRMLNNVLLHPLTRFL